MAVEFSNACYAVAHYSKPDDGNHEHCRNPFAASDLVLGWEAVLCFAIVRFAIAYNPKLVRENS